MGGGHVPSLRIDVEHVILLHAEFEEATRDFRNDIFKLEKVDVLVVGQVEILPGFGLLDLLAANGLGHLLLLLDDVEHVAVSERLARAVGPAGVEQDVVDGVDTLHRGGDEPVVCLLQSADAGLAWLRRWANLNGTLSPGFIGTEMIGIAGHIVDYEGLSVLVVEVYPVPTLDAETPFAPFRLGYAYSE
jgi:hypothetical protein